MRTTAKDRERAVQLAGEHLIVEDDCWYSCPMSGKCCDYEAPQRCLCGYDDRVEAIALALAEQRANDDVPCGMRGEVVWFAQEMERQLQDNDHKDGWEHCSQRWLLNRLRQELAELERAIQRNQDVVAEAADVANFAMMIADNFAHPMADDQ